MRLATLTFLMWAFATACSSRRAQEPRSAGGPSFHADVEPVLIRYCASDGGCHGDDPTHSVKLDLRPGHAYGDLVSVPATTRKGSVRVWPGKPEQSFLLDKLSGPLSAGEGKPMPLDPSTGAPPETSPLPAGFVDHTLRSWIANGAFDDTGRR